MIRSRRLDQTSLRQLPASVPRSPSAAPSGGPRWSCAPT